MPFSNIILIIALGGRICNRKMKYFFTKNGSAFQVRRTKRKEPPFSEQLFGLSDINVTQLAENLIEVCILPDDVL